MLMMARMEGQASLAPLPTPTTGSLNLLVRSRNKGALDTHAWSLSGNKGNVWQQAHVPINPSGPFQVRLLDALGREHLGGSLCLFLVGLGGWRLPGPWRRMGRMGRPFVASEAFLTPASCSLIPLQIIFEGVRGSGYLGDIAIDDVTLKKGECPRKQMDPNKGAQGQEVGQGCTCGLQVGGRPPLLGLGLCLHGIQPA